MTAESPKVALTHKLCKLRRLELQGSTEGERTAAGAAFDRVARQHVHDLVKCRVQIDEIQAKLDGGARLVERPVPQPAREPTIIIRSFSNWAGYGGSTTAGSGWGGVW